MAGSDEQTKSNDLGLDVKKTGPAKINDLEFDEKDLNEVVGGVAPRTTITRPDLCGTAAC